MNPSTPIKLTSQCSDAEHLQGKYINTINGIVGITLTEVEFEIVMILLSKHKGILDAESRKTIKALKGMSIANINNYIGRIRAKGIFLIDPNGTEILNPVYRIPVAHGSELNVTFKVK